MPMTKQEMTKKIKRKILEPLSRLVPDRLFLMLKFRYKMGQWLWLSRRNQPKTYNGKLQWLKLYDRRPIYTTMVDKVAAKDYVARLIGEKHIIKTLGVWERFEDINFDALPRQFVLKTTHDSGGVVVCFDKATLNLEVARQKLETSLRRDYYLGTREWPYKKVPHRILAEEYMVDESGYELKDYKWFCFNGEPRALFVATDRNNPNEDTKFDFFDADFHHLPFTNGHPNAASTIAKPRSFEEMKTLARKLSQGMPHLRVDFYDINGKIYFGELTFYHWSGFVKFEPKEWDTTFGDWLDLKQMGGGNSK